MKPPFYQSYLQKSFTMLQNYFKIAYRHLLRNKSYVLINVFGIGLAMCCCIIGYLNWKFDADFDKMHSQREQIFRVETIKEATGHLHGWSPLPLAATAETDLTEVENGLSVTFGNMTMKKGERVFNENPLITNPDFFDFFDFKIKAGNANTINDPNQVLLSESCAKKYFGTDNPIGQSVTIYAGKPYEKNMEVGAVVEDMPLNSSLQFGVMMNMQNFYSWDKKIESNDWSKLIGFTFLKLKNPAAAPQIAEKLNQYTGIQNSAYERWKVGGFRLEPMTTMAHSALNLRDNWGNSSMPVAAVWGPVVMAILLLLTACLNFANTSISLSNRRLKEMGVRKVMGSSRKSLVVQILAEGLIICLLAMVAGVVFTEFFLPYYNEMWPYLHLVPDYFSNVPLLLFMAGTVIVTTLIAGAYPAFYLSSFNAANIFRGSVNFGGSNGYVCAGVAQYFKTNERNCHP